MLAYAVDSKPRFIRRTSLEAGEYRTNFRQIDCDTITWLTSKKARQVSHSMSQVYLSLVNASSEYFEREGVLHFMGAEEGRKRLTAWKQLCALTGVASSTLSRCIKWLNENGLIGYSAHSNGAGIRIFLNRASRSIGKRSEAKTVTVSPTPSIDSPTPTDGVPFIRRSRDYLESIRTPAPTGAIYKHSSEFPPTEMVSKVISDLSRVITATCSRESALTREWLEKAGIPKAVRVAQHEAFSVLRLNRGAVSRKRFPDEEQHADSPNTMSPDEVVHTWIDFAKNVRGRDLGDLLAEYVVQGDLTQTEASGILEAAGKVT